MIFSSCFNFMYFVNECEKINKWRSQKCKYIPAYIPRITYFTPYQERKLECNRLYKMEHTASRTVLAGMRRNNAFHNVWIRFCTHTEPNGTVAFRLKEFWQFLLLRFLTRILWATVKSKLNRLSQGCTVMKLSIQSLGFGFVKTFTLGMG